MKLENIEFHTAGPKRAFITGATGRIGQPLCLKLAQVGWRLVLVGRGADELEKLKMQLGPTANDHQIAIADLEKTGEGAKAAKDATQMEPVDLFVHLASPPLVEQFVLHDPAYSERMLRVNYSAFLEIAQAVLPGMLAMQNGTIVGILSDQVAFPARSRSAGYAGAKLALAGAISMLADCSTQTGLRCVGFGPGNSKSTSEIVDALVETIQETSLPNGWAHLLMHDGSRKAGLSPWSNDPKALEIKPQVSINPVTAVAEVDPRAAAKEAAIVRADAQADVMLGEIFRRVFDLEEGVDLSTCRWGTVEEWDSLGQLKLLMEVEQAFEISLPSDFVVKVSSYKELRSYLKSLRQN